VSSPRKRRGGEGLHRSKRRDKMEGKNHWGGSGMSTWGGKITGKKEAIKRGLKKKERAGGRGIGYRIACKSMGKHKRKMQKVGKNF